MYYKKQIPIPGDPFEGWRPEPPKRDIVWLKNMYLALCSYGNILHMILLSMYWSNEHFVFDESYRYIKEIIKDGITLGIPISDSESNMDYSQINKWKSNIDGFYLETYGYEASAIVKRLICIEKKYFHSRNRDEGVLLLKDALKLRNIVLNIGLRKRIEEYEKMNGLSLFGIFNDLQLWY